MLASGSDDNTIKIWQLMIPTLQQKVARVIRQNPAVNEQAKTRIPPLLQKRFDIGDGGKTIDKAWKEAQGEMIDLD